MNPVLPVLLVGCGVGGLVVGVLLRGRERHAALAAAVGFGTVPSAPSVRFDWRPVLLLWERRRAEQRRRKFSAQLPDALSLVASSLASGHTLLRSLQLLCDEADDPIASELGRVVHEAELGAPLLDALEAMAARIDVPDLLWVVQAIRIQQEAGGRLAELLHTLSDFMRAREEVRREVLVLTAEGRMSMWVLGLLPVGLMVAMQVLNPGYLDPLFRGWGLFALGAAAASVAGGVAIIRRMVRIEV